jgi:hypothetical protein
MATLIRVSRELCYILGAGRAGAWVFQAGNFQLRGKQTEKSKNTNQKIVEMAKFVKLSIFKIIKCIYEKIYFLLRVSKRIKMPYKTHSN